MAKNDWMLNILEKIDSKTDKHGEALAAIEEHLKTLNGKVLRNINQIETNRSDIEKHKIQWAKVGGMATVISGIIFSIGAVIIKYMGWS